MSMHSVRSQASSRRSALDENNSPSGLDGPSIGIYMGNPVLIQKIVKKATIRFEKDHLILLKQLREMSSSNITQFIGLSINAAENVQIVWTRPGRQTLDELLANDGLKLDFEFKMSLLSDVIKGMEYLHQSPVGCHGRLSTDSSFVDSRMMVKLSGFGMPNIFSDSRLRGSLGSADVNSYLSLYHIAPEVLKEVPKDESGESLFKFFLGCSPKADVFSFGILMYQVLFRKQPYEDDLLSPKEIIDIFLTAKSHTKRPVIPEYEEKQRDSSGQLPKLLEQCWAEQADSRPKPVFIKLKINEFMKSFKGDIVEHMMKLMEKYTSNLENIVAERTQQLAQQQELSENLLASMLPKSVSDALKSGINVEPEWFDNVTIYFSDIVGFTTISAESSAMEIVELLNQLYSTFDQIIQGFDAYKVETIGDAYMVASGVPERNGDNHASVIAEMSLAIRRVIIDEVAVLVLYFPADLNKEIGC